MELFTKNTFTSKPYGTGYTPTVTTLLGRFLKIAEEMFGPRDMEFTILGVEFSEIDQPQIWFPEYPEKKFISIILTPGCETDFNRAIFQLSHEIVHALCPTPGYHANVLEEGVATYFSYQMSEKFGNSMKAGAKQYIEAEKCAEQLLAIKSDVIKEARKFCPDISSISHTQLKTLCPNVGESLLDTLLMPFADFSKKYE